MLDLIIKPSFYYQIAYKSKEPAIYKLYYNSICFLGILNTSLLTQQQNVQQYQQIETILKQITLFYAQIPSFQFGIQSNLINIEQFSNNQYEQYQYLFGNNNLILVISIDVIIRFNNQELIDLLFHHQIFDYQFGIQLFLFILQHLTSLYHLNNQLHYAVFSIFNYLITLDVNRILTQTQILKYLNDNIIKSKKVFLNQVSWRVQKKIGYLILPSLENDDQHSLLKTHLLEFKYKEESFLLNVDLKDCKEIPPISLSIDRQIGRNLKKSLSLQNQRQRIDFQNMAKNMKRKE